MSQKDVPWTLIDNSSPECMRTGNETVSINTEDQLKALLQHFAQGLPGNLILQSPRGELLLVGIGGPNARVLYYANPESDDPGLIAKPPLTFHEPAFFTSEGQASRTGPEHLMTPDTAIRLVLGIYRTGSVPAWIEWEEE
jgi:hypothetical protein